MFRRATYGKIYDKPILLLTRKTDNSDSGVEGHEATEPDHGDVVGRALLVVVFVDLDFLNFDLEKKKA